MKIDNKKYRIVHTEGKGYTIEKRLFWIWWPYALDYLGRGPTCFYSTIFTHNTLKHITEICNKYTAFYYRGYWIRAFIQPKEMSWEVNYYIPRLSKKSYYNSTWFDYIHIETSIENAKRKIDEILNWRAPKRTIVPLTNDAKC